MLLPLEIWRDQKENELVIEAQQLNLAESGTHIA